MRIKITIWVILVFFSLLLASHFLPSTPQVTLTFIGRPGLLPRYRDDSLAASFMLTNNSARLLYSSEGKARIQIKTTNGWTNVVTDSPDSPDDWVEKPIDQQRISPYGNWWIHRHVPQNHVTWRLQVTYIVPAPQWTRIVFLEPVASILKVRDREYSVYSQEMPSEPAR